MISRTFELRFFEKNQTHFIMKKFILLVALGLIVAPAFAQKSKKSVKTNIAPAKEAVIVENPEESLAKAIQSESRMMGPMHHLLVQWSGHWREEIKLWATPNTKEPSITPAIRDGRMAAEGRFLTSTTVGQIGTTPYEAQSVLGFDNAKKVFVKTWFDNLGTSILVLEGTYDEKANVVDFVGYTTDPLTRRAVKVHQIMRLIDPSTQVLEVFVELKEGKETKSMEIISIRS
jgi:hypothetical protein